MREGDKVGRKPLGKEPVGQRTGNLGRVALSPLIFAQRITELECVLLPVMKRNAGAADETAVVAADYFVFCSPIAGMLAEPARQPLLARSLVQGAPPDI